MEKRQFKIGDKVKIPKTKSVDLNTPLHKSTAISNAKKINQDFLYVVENNHPRYTLGADLRGFDSSFHFQDLEHYEEFPKKWAIELYPDVKKWIEDEFKSSFYTKHDKSYIFHFPNFESGNGFLSGNHTNSKVGEGYTRITLEQFKKHILKEKTMGKEIKGYVLIKEYPGSKGLGYFEKYTTGELDKYPEFWKPVYEEEFKVGDWVTIIKDSKGERDNIKKGINYTFKIAKIEQSYLYNDIWLVSDKDNNKSVLSGYCRKATPEEIEAAQKTIIKMHSSNKGEFEIEVVDGKAWYRPENKELPKEWIKSIIGSYHHWKKEVNTNYPYDIKVDGVDVGCYSKTKKEDWEKVYKLLK